MHSTTQLTHPELSAATINKPEAPYFMQATQMSWHGNPGSKMSADAVEYSVTIDLGQTIYQALASILSEKEAKRLVTEAALGVQANLAASRTNLATLFINSNNRSRDEQRAEFAERNASFASYFDMMLVCAALVHKAEVAGLDLAKNTDTWTKEQTAACVSIGELNLKLLSSLKRGVVRAGHLNFSIDNKGVLHFNKATSSEASPTSWAVAALLRR